MRTVRYANVCSRARSTGFGILGWLGAIVLGFTAILILLIAFYEGRKAYWDHQISKMCEKDAGVTVYERTKISAEQAEELPKIEGAISIPHKALAGTQAPLVSEDIRTVLKEWSPRVVRRETIVTRQVDSRVVGKMVAYSRSGGDFPTGMSEGSSFGCPENKQLYAAQARFFVIEKAK